MVGQADRIGTNALIASLLRQSPVPGQPDSSLRLPRLAWRNAGASGRLGYSTLDRPSTEPPGSYVAAGVGRLLRDRDAGNCAGFRRSWPRQVDQGCLSPEWGDRDRCRHGQRAWRNNAATSGNCRVDCGFSCLPFDCTALPSIGGTGPILPDNPTPLATRAFSPRLVGRVDRSRACEVSSRGSEGARPGMGGGPDTGERHPPQLAPMRPATVSTWYNPAPSGA
jgi:hypothetical protein